MDTKNQLEEEIARLETIMEELQTRLRCSNLYLNVSLMCIILAVMNAVKISLAREPDEYNKGLACFTALFVAEVQRIAGIDIVASTKGRILALKGFDQATSITIEQQVNLCRLLVYMVFGDAQVDSECAKISDEAVKEFIKEWLITESGGALTE